MRKRKLFGRDILYRFEGNPILSIDDVDFRCLDIRNAGAVSRDGEPLLLVTVQELAGVQTIHLARRAEHDYFELEKEPFLKPAPEGSREHVHESNGVMDARVTLLDDTYYIMYLAYGEYGYRLGLATTKDFVVVERHGLIAAPDTKAGALFPARIGGKYARLERPRDGYSIWISFSEDLVYWGDSEIVLSPRGGFWDADRIGAGPPPIKIDEGWLLIYYGAKNAGAGSLYRLGAAILAEDDPTRVVGRANIPLIAPREYYERIGDVNNLVFSTGALIDEEGEIRIYYGAANSCICKGTVSVEAIVAVCLESEKEF